MASETSSDAGRGPAHHLDRRVLLMWWTTSGLWALGAVVVAAIAWAVLPAFPWIALPIAAVIVVAAISLPPLRYRRWRYEIRARDLFLSRGAVFLTRSLIPFDRIQFVETREGPLDKAFGLNQLVVYTAAGRAAQIPGLAVAEAESLREELSKVAGAVAV